VTVADGGMDITPTDSHRQNIAGVGVSNNYSLRNCHLVMWGSLPWGFLWFVSRGLKVGLFCGLLLVGSVVRLLLLVYSVCIRGALRCFFLIKLQLLIKKKISTYYQRHPGERKKNQFSYNQ